MSEPFDSLLELIKDMRKWYEPRLSSLEEENRKLKSRVEYIEDYIRSQNKGVL